MAIKPIMFNTEMVRAILDEKKTQTRRVVKGIDGINVYRAVPSEDSYESLSEWDFLFGGRLPDGGMYDAFQSVKAPCGVGDILWVREAFLLCFINRFLYRADDADGAIERGGWKWKPSIHMPREAARIFLRVKDVRVERLQSILERGRTSATAEGFVNDIDLAAGTGASATKHFSVYWDSTIKKADLPRYGWDANPWVWVIEFERCEEPKGWCE